MEPHIAVSSVYKKRDSFQLYHEAAHALHAHLKAKLMFVGSNMNESVSVELDNPDLDAIATDLPGLPLFLQEMRRVCSQARIGENMDSYDLNIRVR